MKQYQDILVEFDGCGFLDRYFDRQFPTDEDAEPMAPRRAVLVVNEGAERESVDAFLSRVEAENLPCAVLRCRNIIGTGMNGLMHRIAEGIYRGSYINIRDNQARCSAIHAIDVAAAAELATDGEYTLTDGIDHTFTDIADALAYRIGQKRLFVLPARWARLWLGRKFFYRITTDDLAREDFTSHFPTFVPVDVTDYLRTHVYDQNSL